MTRYRHALWGASPAWPHGYVFGAPVPEFKRAFPAKVKELGIPLRVWESDSEGECEEGTNASA